MANFGPLAAEIGLPANFSGYCFLTALPHGSQVVGVSQNLQRCGVEQRAPPMFGRATITLGIVPHSSLDMNPGRRNLCSHADTVAVSLYDEWMCLVAVCFCVVWSYPCITLCYIARQVTSGYCYCDSLWLAFVRVLEFLCLYLWVSSQIDRSAVAVCLLTEVKKTVIFCPLTKCLISNAVNSLTCPLILKLLKLLLLPVKVT